MITIQPVRTGREISEFVRVSRAIYPRESPWVRPLNSVVSGYLNPRRNPFYRDGIGQAFLARCGDKTIGRSLAVTWIAAQNDASRAQAEALKMRCLRHLAMYERPLRRWTPSLPISLTPLVARHRRTAQTRQ